MKTIFGLTMKSSTHDPFLLFWSILLPVGGLIGLGLLVKSPEYPTVILTGMMAVSCFFYALVTNAFSVFSQRRRGVYNLLRVTPLPLWKYVFSVSFAKTIIAFLCSILVLIVGIVIFDINVTIISLMLIISVLLIAIIGYVFLSFFVASLSKNESHVNIFSNIIMLPFIFCSDAFYSLEKAPEWIKAISRFNPFQWFINGLRNALNLNLTSYLIDIALLMIMAAVTLLLAVRTFRFMDK